MFGWDIYESSGITLLSIIKNHYTDLTKWFSITSLPSIPNIPNCGCHPYARLILTSFILFFPFGRWVAGRSFLFSKASLAWGGRMQGFTDKYARSEARGRFIGKRHSRLTLKPTISPRACFAFVNGKDCSALPTARKLSSAFSAFWRKVLSYWFIDFNTSVRQTYQLVCMVICLPVDMSSRLPPVVGFTLRE